MCRSAAAMPTTLAPVAAGRNSDAASTRDAMTMGAIGRIRVLQLGYGMERVKVGFGTILCHCVRAGAIVGNMQWRTVREGRTKGRWECRR